MACAVEACDGSKSKSVVHSVVQRSDMSSNIEDIIDEVTWRLSLGWLKPKQMEVIIAFVGG